MCAKPSRLSSIFMKIPKSTMPVTSPSTMSPILYLEIISLISSISLFFSEKISLFSFWSLAIIVTFSFSPFSFFSSFDGDFVARNQRPDYVFGAIVFPAVNDARADRREIHEKNRAFLAQNDPFYQVVRFGDGKRSHFHQNIHNSQMNGGQYRFFFLRGGCCHNLQVYLKTIFLQEILVLL